MKIQLSDHFSYPRLIRFTLPTIFMMVFTSLYGIVDGFFVSNYVSKTAFAAVNLVMPVLIGVGTIGFMFGTGGSAIVSRTLGEQRPDLANRYFSLLVYTACICGLVLSVAGYVGMRPIAAALGAQGQLLEDCVVYGRILFLAQMPFLLQVMFQSFFVTAEQPGLSLLINILAGVTNAVLDYVCIVVLDWGIAGAALATAAGQLIGCIIPLFYFALPNRSLLRLTRTSFYGGMLWRTCLNGASEMVTNLSTSIVGMLYNFQLLRLAGEDGIAAYGIIMYANFIFMAIYLGYAIGSSPIVSYHLGAGNRRELQSLFRKSLILSLLAGAAMTLLAEATSRPLVAIFASYDAALMDMTLHGFRLYALAFVLMGLNVWGSAFFTALGDGLTSALISFLRTLVFQIVAVLLLPALFGLDGIWGAVVLAELLAAGVTMLCLIRKRNVYHYL